MTEPEISFILPAYHPRTSWLSEAMTSVLDQRGPQIELVLVDDGSPRPVAEMLGDKDSRTRVIRVGHAGVSAARNAGIEAARGAWLRFIDSDDVVPAESNLNLLRRAKDSGAQIVVGATEYFGENLMPAQVGQAGAHDDFSLACLRGRVDTHIGAMLIHRDVIASAGLFDVELNVMEDFDFAIRTFAATTRAIPDVVYRYRRHHASVTARASVDEADQAWDRVVRRFFDRHPELDSSPLRRELRGLRALDAAGAHAAAGNAAKMLSSLSSAAGNAPARATKALPRLLAQLALASRRCPVGSRA